MRARHAHTGSGRGSEILASAAKRSKNIHSKSQVCSYHSFKVISVLKPKFGICAKCPLFSDPVTYFILLFWKLGSTRHSQTSTYAPNDAQVCFGNTSSSNGMSDKLCRLVGDWATDSLSESSTTGENRGLISPCCHNVVGKTQFVHVVSHLQFMLMPESIFCVLKHTGICYVAIKVQLTSGLVTLWGRRLTR